MQQEDTIWLVTAMAEGEADLGPESSGTDEQDQQDKLMDQLLGPSPAPETTPDASGGRGLRSAMVKGRAQLRQRVQRVPIKVEVLQENMAGLMKNLATVLSSAQASLEDGAQIELDQVELSVQVSAKGEVSLLGMGTEVGTTGGIKLVFKRKAAGSKGGGNGAGNG